LLLERTGRVLTSAGDRIQGIHDTILGGVSKESVEGTHYLEGYEASNAIDGKDDTKYRNFGHDWTGLKSGFYVTPEKGASILIGIQFTTGGKSSKRDPMKCTLEGSNREWRKLTKGSSWINIATCSTGIKKNSGRGKRGLVVRIPNAISYTSYRLLITEKNDNLDLHGVEYSRCTFLKYFYPTPPSPVRLVGAAQGTDYDDDNESLDCIGWNVDAKIPDFSLIPEHAHDDDDKWHIE